MGSTLRAGGRRPSVGRPLASIAPCRQTMGWCYPCDLAVGEHRPLRAGRGWALPLWPGHGRALPLAGWPRRSPLLAALATCNHPFRGLAVVDRPCEGPGYGRSPPFLAAFTAKT
ncbi:hypothetical protein BHM03_00051986 [Ensete ventricosum]|uniref:Uncharacterized protein n=1 Tax=Ensete ventricosum TaxID=4639 RepID=A0A445MLT3_ENSVE|nr:hypothetical protein BHM03_00051986 [Ensete ventricosum]